MAAIPRASLGLVAIMLLALDIVLPSVHAQAPAPAPTSDGDLIFILPFCFPVVAFTFLSKAEDPIFLLSLQMDAFSSLIFSPSSLIVFLVFVRLTYCFFVGAGASIDQGIAYLLLLVALVLTYLVHPLDDASTPLKALIN
ncbi:hypothetical protein BHE74_00046723 [Ensete ventricosum]|nr:hypothetical protein BHE74_00046723 [Ensete ventricosum]